MNDQDVRELLIKRAAPYALNKGSTGFTEWCRHHGVQKSHASEFLRGIRPHPPSDVLEALRLEVRYARKKIVRV